MMVLTRDEARRAVYIDYEGTAGDSPSLLGVLAGDTDAFHQRIIEAALAPCVARGHADLPGAVLVASPVEALQEVIELAAREHRRIVSWSSREKSVAGDTLPANEYRRFEDLWVNAIPTARRHLRSEHPDVVLPRVTGSGRNRLSAYVDLIGYDVPAAYGSQNAAQRIRSVRGQLALRGDWESLTPVVKAKWTKLLRYNYHDCAGMRAVMLWATR